MGKEVTTKTDTIEQKSELPICSKVEAFIVYIDSESFFDNESTIKICVYGTVDSAVGYCSRKIRVCGDYTFTSESTNIWCCYDRYDNRYLKIFKVVKAVC